MCEIAQCGAMCAQCAMESGDFAVCGFSSSQRGPLERARVSLLARCVSPLTWVPPLTWRWVSPDMASRVLPNLACVSLDLEVGTRDNRIHKIGAVRSDTGASFHRSVGDLDKALEDLDRFARGASYLLGHNIIEFDLKHLQAASPHLKLLKLPVVDTLRLNPLAFPAHPYHHLVKHYQDAGLQRGQINNPELDSKLALDVFHNQCEKFKDSPPDLLTAWHWLCTSEHHGIDLALDVLFSALRSSGRPSEEQARTAMRNRLSQVACRTHTEALLATADQLGWPLAFALAWLSVAGGNSVLPPWVLYRFPQTGKLLRALRDSGCPNPDCEWCRERHDPSKELKRWFGFDSFRPEPSYLDGRPMQQVIVESAFEGEHLLGILPTGTGKSLCYQIPALSRYDKTGALTVVISPLVALMADQVKGLESQGIGCAVAVNGLLSMPERSDALERVRLGDTGILIISPEQLRSRPVRRALNQREIGSWVIDEAHCLSGWGHDFRPDYRYLGRFIRERARGADVPPILCLTATAKPDVRDDIINHFRDRLGIELKLFDGGAERSNLSFEVVPTGSAEKYPHVHQVLESHLPVDGSGGAIVYCATRRQSEEIAEFLQDEDWSADYFHAGLSPEVKKDVQQRFIAGELRVIAATNAFGMGIDKPDVRVVIHADVPGSLENYLQEAGRAGRDRDAARCVLLYAPGDVEDQFRLSARSRLTRQEIHGILRALRNLDRRKRFGGDVVATVGEILTADEDQLFEQDALTDDTRVRTAVSWLEDADLLTRDENRVEVFPSSLRVNTLEQAGQRLARAELTEEYRKSLLLIAQTLMQADADEAVTTDELMGASGLSSEGVRNALYDMERLGIASNDSALTAFVHEGVANSSSKRLQEASNLEIALIDHMREAYPDQAKGDESFLHLRVAAQKLREQELSDPLPERLWRILRSISADGRGEDGASGSLDLRKLDSETVRVVMRREWSPLNETAQMRRDAARLLLDHLLQRLPEGSRGVDLLAETTLGNLAKAIDADLLLKSRVKHVPKLIDHALLWLHEQEVIRLNKGLAVFRPAMTIRLRQEERRGFNKVDFQPLALHYQGKVLQIHVMKAFAEKGLEAMADAMRLAMDYFSLKQEDFLDRWMPDQEKELTRQTTPQSWRAIVESLKNPIQQRIVADDREQTNVLVLAGPGSGKTRVLVHRIAYLVRVRRENPRSILALAYNRHSAVDIRRRLQALIGKDARSVTVLTCHGMAMRLAGASFEGSAERPSNELFDEVLQRAVDILQGEGLLPEEADERRERLLSGFRWILVDEYQDVDAQQYALISALAGRTRDEDDGKLTIFAVGDDDQNIYSFAGASVEFIRKFQEDYGPRPEFLVANYRSTGRIINAANALIDSARERMKAEHPISINRARAKDRPGGAWQSLDPVGRGHVQILHAGRDAVSQAISVIAELQRLQSLDRDWDWSRCAVIAREWEYLAPVRALCEREGVLAQMANEEIPGFWRLRETQQFIDWLRARESQLIPVEEVVAWTEEQPPGPWQELLRQAIEEYQLESMSEETTVNHLIEWLAEWGRDIRRRQRGLLLLTAHRAKGLEFDHVVVLDGGWDKSGGGEDRDAPRRLYYVAMTRARQTLTLAALERPTHLLNPLRGHPSVKFRQPSQRLADADGLGRRHTSATLEQVNIGFAGRFSPENRVHKSIAQLSAGDALDVRKTREGRWNLHDARGTLVGTMARSFEPPKGKKYQSARVMAIIKWNREISDPKFLQHTKCDSWEVVIPELIFE